MTEGKTGEQEAQKDYEAMLQDSKEKRATDAQSMADKASVKADTEAALQQHTASKMAAEKEHMATLQYDMMLHTECDWLLENFDMRREARTNEIDSLKKAKDVLSGADFSLLEKHSKHQ